MVVATWAVLLVVTLAAAVMATVAAITSGRWRPANWKSRRAAADGRPGPPPGRLGPRLVGDRTLSFIRAHPASTVSPLASSLRPALGPVFKARLFGLPTVVSMDPSLNRWVLANEGRLFRSSYPASVRRILGRWSMLALEGEEHRHMRSIALAFAARPDKLRSPAFLRTLHSHAVGTLSAWAPPSSASIRNHPNGGPCFLVQAHATSKKFTFNVMVNQILGLKPGEPDNLFFLEHYQHFMKGLVSLPINLPWTAYSKAFKSKESILKKLNEIMTERSKARKVTQNEDGATPSVTHDPQQSHPDQQQDFLDHIMNEGSLCEDQVLDLIMNMLFAGHETSSVALTLSIGFLAKSPMALKKLRDEHERIRSKNRAQAAKDGLCKGYLDQVFINAWDDYKSMDYTQCVIKETLRLGNVVRFVHREAMQDITFGGYKIPKGWQVLPMFEAPHLDDGLYENPLEFLPERWQNMNHKAISSFTPFGGGIRMCAGIEFAKLEIATFLHHLVLNFDWSLVEPHAEMALAFPYVDFPNSLPIKVKRLSEQQQ